MYVFNFVKPVFAAEDVFCSGTNGINTALGCIPIDDTSSFIGWFFQNIIGVVGGIALLLIGFGAIQIITSAGNQDKVKGGKELIVSAITGLVFVIFSLFLLSFIGVDILHLPGLTK
jgi:hypothetical protein